MLAWRPGEPTGQCAEEAVSCGRQQGLSWAIKNGDRVSFGGNENVQELDNGGQLYNLVNVGKITDLHN